MDVVHCLKQTSAVVQNVKDNSRSKAGIALRALSAWRGNALLTSLSAHLLTQVSKAALSLF